MTVEELINQLKKHPPYLEVLITDGHDCRCYRGDFMVQPYVDCGEVMYVDIGIGGCNEEAL